MTLVAGQAMLSPHDSIKYITFDAFGALCDGFITNK